MLRRVAQHMTAGSSNNVASQPEPAMDTYSVSVDPSLADAGWPLRLRQHDDGSMFVTDLDLLKERELAAARDCKYRLAAQLYAI